MTEPSATTEAARSEPGLFRRLLGDVRGRIIASYVVLLLLSGLATVLIVRSVLLVRVDDEAEAALVQEAGEFSRLSGGVDPRTGEPFAGQVKRIFDVFLSRNIPSEREQLITVPASGRASIRPQPVPGDEPALAGLIESWRSLTATSQGEIETDEGTVRYLAIPVFKGQTPRAAARIDGEAADLAPQAEAEEMTPAKSSASRPVSPGPDDTLEA